MQLERPPQRHYWVCLFVQGDHLSESSEAHDQEQQIFLVKVSPTKTTEATLFLKESTADIHKYVEITIILNIVGLFTYTLLCQVWPGCF